MSPIDLWDGDPQRRLADATNGIRKPAPLPGQHTAEILEGLLRFTPLEITAMQTDGVLIDLSIEV